MQALTTAVYNFIGYWQINFARSGKPGTYDQATALLHSLNALILRFR